MKKLPFAIATLLLLGACSSNKASEGEEQDSISNAADTLSLEIETEEQLFSQQQVPAAADSVFYDFLSSFCQNSQYQEARIKFPLQRQVHGLSQPIEREDWEFSRLHYTEDAYTVFFPKLKDLSLESSTQVEDVTVQWFDQPQNQAIYYRFKKLKGRWMLLSIDEHTFAEDPDNQFLSFYHQFAQSDEFRRAHLSETILYDGIDPDGSDDEFDMQIVKNKKIPSSHWREQLIPQLPAEQFTNIDFGQKLQGPQRIVSLESPSSGFTSRLHFRREQDSWELFRIENY